MFKCEALAVFYCVKHNQNLGDLSPPKLLYPHCWYTYLKMAREVERTFPVEMDHRGRITVPANIRQAHDIDPPEGEETWLEVTIHEVNIRKDGGES